MEVQELRSLESNGTLTTNWQVAVGRKQHEQRKMLDKLSC